MSYLPPLTCPACQHNMLVTELSCEHCGTRVQGQFESVGLLRLNAEQLRFVETFLRCRGNIKEVEKDLKISYPTVRSRLDQVIAAMGYPVVADDIDPLRQGEGPSAAEAILDELDSGVLNFEDALQRLRKEGNEG